MYVRRKAFTKLAPRVGKKFPINIIAVGAARLLANCGGYDVTLSQRDLSYGMLGDLRDKYHPGDKLMAVLKEYDEENHRLFKIFSIILPAYHNIIRKRIEKMIEYSLAGKRVLFRIEKLIRFFARMRHKRAELITRRRI